MKKNKFAINKYRNFIFDFDGVIADSVEIKTLAFKQLFEREGKGLARKIARHHKAHGGVSRFDKIRYYTRVFLNRDISERQVRVLAGKFSKIVLGKVIRAPLIKGARKFMESLKGKNLYLISATPGKEIKLIVRKKGLDKYFACVLGSPLAKKENLKFLMDKYGLNSGESVYFGDSQEDKQAAACFKIRFVPINYADKRSGYRNFQELLKS